MHGRGPHRFGWLLLLALTGCGGRYDAAPVASRPHAPQLGSAFDPAQCGTIEGQVIWDGPLPKVPDLVVQHAPDVPAPDGRRVTHEPNPFAPQVDAASHGVRDAVVFLRGVEPARAAPWPHGTPRVEQSGRQIRVVQAGQAGRVGFVQAGQRFDAVNRDREYHLLRGRGAAFFSLPFVEPDRVTRQRLDRPGVVVLSSGTGFYWMQAHLIVAGHPYYARTDRAGRFRLEQVPAGTYEAVCWLPSWVIARKDREPESGMVNRLVFAPPLEQAVRLEVSTGTSTAHRFVWTAPE